MYTISVPYLSIPPAVRSSLSKGRQGSVHMRKEFSICHNVMNYMHCASPIRFFISNQPRSLQYTIPIILVTFTQYLCESIPPVIRPSHIKRGT